METKSGADEVAIVLKQVSVPAARRDYELRSSSPAPKREVAPAAMKKLSPSSSSSELVSRAFQNARAMSFNAAATHSSNVDASTVPFVLHQAPNRRVFFSGPLASRASDDTVRASAVAAPRERSDSDVVAGSFSRSFRHSHELSFQRNQAQLESARHRPAGRSKSGVLDPARVQDASRSSMADIDRGPAFRRARSGELRAPRTSTTSRPHSSELPRELFRGASWLASEEQTIHARARSGEITRATEEDSKKQTESRRRPTASIAWDSLNEFQSNSPQHELAAIPFRWEEAPGKPLGEIAMAKSTGVQDSQQQDTATTESALSRAHSHRFYARSAPLEQARKSSFDATAAARISEVASSEAQIDLVAPAAARFLVDSNWGAPRTVAAAVEADEANVAVPFQWEAAPGVAKHDETDGMDSSKPAQLQLPPRLVAPPALSEAALSKEEMRGRNRTRAMSGPLTGYHRHTSPSRRRQLQHSPAPAPTHRSSSPSKLVRSVSPSRIPQAIAHHFSRKTKDPAVPEAELQYSPGTDALARCASKRSSSPSRIRAIAQHFTRNDRDPHPSTQISQHSSITASLEAELRDSGAQGSSYLGPCPSNRSTSPSRIHAIAQHFSSHKSKHSPSSTQISPQSSITASLLEPDLRNTEAPEDLEQSPSGALSSEFGSRRIHALANQLTCKATPSGNSKGHVQWSPTTSRNLHDEVSHLSGPTSSSSNSDMDVASQTPVDSDAAFSKSFSQASYESFEHSFAHRASSPPSPSPEAAERTQSHETNSGANSQPGSPYLGPIDDDFRTRKASVGAAEGVKAVVKMCTFRKSKTHGATHEMWAPTLASYFRSLETATLITSPARSPSPAITNTAADHECNIKQGCSGLASEDHVNVKPLHSSHVSEDHVNACKQGCSGPASDGPVNASNHGHSRPTSEEHFDACEQEFSGFSSEDHAVNAMNGFSEHSNIDPIHGSKEAATRLAYTTPNSPNYVEPNAIWKEYCESPNAAELRTTCLGTVKLAASRVNSKYSAMARSSERHHAYDSGLDGASGNASAVVEDGYRSPAYAATLELLSPSAELCGRGRKRISRFKGIKLALPSGRRKAQIMEAMCTSLKRALYKCAKRCCRKACSAPPLSSTHLR